MSWKHDDDLQALLPVHPDLREGGGGGPRGEGGGRKGTYHAISRI